MGAMAENGIVRAPGTPIVDAPPIERTLAEQRVDHIENLMAQAVYVPGVTCKQLARQWELSTSRVQHFASEAARNLRRAMGDREEIRTRYLASIEAIRVRALARTRPRWKIVDGVKVEVSEACPDFRSALTAIETAGKFLGLVREDVYLHAGGSDPFAGWSIEEMEQYSRAGEVPARLRAAHRDHNDG